MLLTPLARRTKERAPFTLEAPDVSAAARPTRLAGPIVHEVTLPVHTLGPIRREEVTHSGPSLDNCLCEYRAHRVVQASDRPGLQPIGFPVRVQPCPIEDLIGIDVADPGNHLLVLKILKNWKPRTMFYKVSRGSN